jgi:hypothetical protein
MISDLYDALVVVFKQYECPAAVYLGEQYRAQNTETLRVVMWPSGDKFTPQNGSVLSEPARRFWRPINPRSTATRKAGFEVELWATAPVQRNPVHQYRADLAYLDALVNQFAIAMQQIASGLFELAIGDSAPSNAAAGVAGLGYTLQCSVDVPVIDAKWPAQQLDACTKTWAEASGSATITVDGKVDPEPPHYQTGQTFTVPTEED